MRRPQLFAFALAAAAGSAIACEASSPANTVALIELYTSQGCSSCPPADRWLSRLARELPPHRAVPIALHVGYWDYIGWKDPFARREFNARQSKLAAANGSRTVYTPGVFVQGREARWSQPAAAFDAELRAINRRPAEARIAFREVAAHDRRVEFTVQADVAGKSGDARLYVTLVQSGLSTAVAAGENRGATLANDRVVRAWQELAPGMHRVGLDAPSGATPDLTLVAFVEDKTGVLQALQLPLASCR
jgi:hypothetical protein